MRFTVDINRISGLVVGILGMLLTACASSTLTLKSQPEGAYITELKSGKAHGIGPIAINLSPDALKKDMGTDGCSHYSGYQARWVSGATKVVPQIILCGGPAFGDYTITLVRDPAAPGLDKDLQFVLQLQTVRAKQQQAQAASDAADAATWPSKSSPVSCSSYKLGSTVQTDCR